MSVLSILKVHSLLGIGKVRLGLVGWEEAALLGQRQERPSDEDLLGTDWA